MHGHMNIKKSLLVSSEHINYNICIYYKPGKRVV